MRLIERAIDRPVATSLLMLGLCLAGLVSFFVLPAAPVPQIDYPVISIGANMPGASPEIMASSVATPLERRLGQIAGVTEMTSASYLGSTRINLQFDLDRNVDGAQRDIQAAIAAARADMPANLRSNPTFRSANPAEVPVVIIALTSDRLSQGALFEVASNILQQKFSQVEGVGQVTVGGGALPAVRVEVNPRTLFQYGLSLESVRTALGATNYNGPKGAFDSGDQRYQIYANDQSRKARDYDGVIVGYRNGAAVKLHDVAEVIDSVEDDRNFGVSNGRPGVQVQIYRQPGANFIELVDRIKALMGPLSAALPAEAEMRIVQDRTLTIRTSLREIETTLALSVVLVIAVVFIFLRDPRATVVPGVCVVVSLLGALVGMYLLDYSLNNLSLMALTIATGFIVDDAIVVVENVTRLMESGMPPRRAALLGARQVAFTVLSMTLSLIAVFLPIMFMGGIVGRMMREFAATLSIAVLVSLLLSLTTAPMLCAHLLQDVTHAARARLFEATEVGLAVLHRLYLASLGYVLDHRRLVLFALLALVGVNQHLFTIIPKGFFPVQDTGRMRGAMIADQSASFTVTKKKLEHVVAILQNDPGIESATGWITSSANFADLLVTLKPLKERGISAEKILARLRPKFAQVPGVQLFLQSTQDIRIGGRSSNALFQYTLLADSLEELRLWGPRITEALKRHPTLADVSSDQMEKGLRSDVVVDRETAARLNVSSSQIDNTLYDAFGQRQVSTIFEALNQYHVVLELAPKFRESPNALAELYIGARGGQPPVITTSRTPINGLRALSLPANASERMIPFASFSSLNAGPTPMQVNHQGHFAAVTVSFNLAEGKALSDAATAISETIAKIGAPGTIQGAFAGTAASYQETLANQPFMVAAALAAVYIVLGILYESFFHPLTILSTLPSAGLGALAALLLCGTDFSIVAMIGVLLLIGVVMKNAIILVDFAIDAERTRAAPALDAIVEACGMRFRPILMTTLVSIMGAAPLAIASGEGAEMRQPLGVAIIGGLVVSQLLTLYTTPVVFLYVDKAERLIKSWRIGLSRPSELKTLFRD
ncbi:efflux RND transporter permease subunit [Methylocystis sp. JR02]|uniref:efflux RND transporter permease subunit n=1 Tax=Methylocystis sp. JR02 TaxID=3046284 RepID=UPI0024B9218D|nr:efflux RND transporter permease subunit [Methylocystis sp. JR02]MDJ0447248.1 efflux RND transporter permease subunit [Methylocystis sp. JR02]